MNTEIVSLERHYDIANKVIAKATTVKASKNESHDVISQIIASLKLKGGVENLVIPEVPNEDDLDINDVLDNPDITSICSELALIGLDATIFIQGSSVVLLLGSSDNPDVIYQLDRDVELSISCRHFSTFLSNIELISDELIVPFANAAFADVIKHIESIH